MLLAVDVGNTNTVLGLFEGDRLLVHWRVSTDVRKTADEYAMLLKNLFECHHMTMNSVDAVAISSVVPPLTPVLETMVRRYFRGEPLVVGPGVKTGMPIRFDNPREVGADRIVNAVAAYALYGGPVIVVDFGTATTYDVVSRNGEYWGGAIAPGIGISMEALFQQAAKLPRVEFARPRTLIGKNTVQCIQAGIYYGFVAQVEGVVARMKEELKEEAFVVATGGLASLIASGTQAINRVNPLLTLEGLRLIYKRNQPV